MTATRETMVETDPSSKKDVALMHARTNGKPAERIRLAYISAASHSGSTLLAMLLAGHPKICTVGEMSFTLPCETERYKCSCGRWIRECPFWDDVRDRMLAHGVRFDVADPGTALLSGATAYVRWCLRPLHRGPLLERVRDAALGLSTTWRRRLPAIFEANYALARAVCEATGRPVIVDSSKVGLRLKYLRRHRGFDLKVIRLVRDGRAVALTYMDPARFADATDPRLRGGGAGDDRASHRMPIRVAARDWRRCNEDAECAIAALDPSRRIEVRYEELCTATEATLRRIWRFLGLEPALLANWATERHVVGNGVRFDRDIEVRLDDRWRSVLSAADLEVFEEVAGALNHRYGYV